MGLYARDGQTGKKRVPVWFMRQAGRYHQHYQNIRSKNHFMQMCKTPELACEITLGPIQDFHFDAAILFSDLLFPLEQLGMGLSYKKGPPELGFHLDQAENMQKLQVIAPGEEFYRFQAQAIQRLKTELSTETTLLGFVGAPFTLFTYAVNGSHSGNIIETKKALYDGRFEKFLELLLPQLKIEMDIQAEAGADGVCLFDTAAGELSAIDYHQFVVPVLEELVGQFKGAHPNVKLTYYSKHTHLDYLRPLVQTKIDVFGLDWRHDLPKAFEELGQDCMIQGNIDPVWLFLPWEQLEKRLVQLKQSMQKEQLNWDRWIFGLGHGVLPKTPEENVRKTVQWVHENLVY